MVQGSPPLNSSKSLAATVFTVLLTECAQQSFYLAFTSLMYQNASLISTRTDFFSTDSAHEMPNLYSTVQNLAAEANNSTGAGPAMSHKPPSGLSLNLLKWFFGAMKWIVCLWGSSVVLPTTIIRQLEKNRFFLFSFQSFFCLFVPLQARYAVPSQLATYAGSSEFAVVWA